MLLASIIGWFLSQVIEFLKIALIARVFGDIDRILIHGVILNLINAGRPLILRLMLISVRSLLLTGMGIGVRMYASRLILTLAMTWGLDVSLRT